MFCGYEIDLNMILHDALHGKPPWLDAKSISDLLRDNNLASCSYYICHDMNDALRYESYHTDRRGCNTCVWRKLVVGAGTSGVSGSDRRGGAWPSFRAAACGAYAT